MPGIDTTPNYFRVRQKPPSQFSKFRIKEIGDGIKLVLGKYKDRDEWDVQSIMFPRDKFKTKDEVRKWIKEHGFKISSQKRLYDIWAKNMDMREDWKVNPFGLWVMLSR